MMMAVWRVWCVAVVASMCVLRAQGHDGAFEQRKIAAAEFALEELRRTSDSGVYDSIKLLEVISAVEEEGIYHHNMIMELKLGSPYFFNGVPYGYFSVVVMRHKETGGRSLAIDEFPFMDEAAVEKYWIAKVERKRAEREEAFRRMELEALLLEDGDNDQGTSTERTEQEPRVTQDSLHDVSVEDLFGILEDVLPEHAEKRSAASRVLLGHLHRYREKEGLSRSEEESRLRQIADMEEEETLLQEFSLQELYTLSKGSEGGLFSDYLVYRSRQLLDTMLSKYV